MTKYSELTNLSDDTIRFVKTFGEPPTINVDDPVRQTKTTLEWGTPIKVRITEEVGKFPVVEIYTDKWTTSTFEAASAEMRKKATAKPDATKSVDATKTTGWNRPRESLYGWSIKAVTISVCLALLIGILGVKYIAYPTIAYFTTKPDAVASATSEKVEEVKKKGWSWGWPTWMTWKKTETVTKTEDGKVKTEKKETVETPAEKTETKETVTLNQVPTPSVQSAMDVVAVVKSEVRAETQQTLDALKKLYDAAHTEFVAATAELAQLDAAKVALGKAWCKENQDAWDAAKAKADAATLTKKGLNNRIFALQDQLDNGGATVIALDMLNGVSMQMVALNTDVQAKMTALETRMEAKLDKTSGELKAEMKSVKDAVNTMKTELLDRLATHEKTIGGNLTKILTAIVAIPGQTAEDLKDVSALVETVHKEVLKHKNTPAEIQKLELQVKDLQERLQKMAEQKSAQASTPQAPSAPPPVQKTAPIPAPQMQGYYQPACQPGYTCPVPQYQYSMPQQAYGYRK